MILLTQFRKCIDVLTTAKPL